MNYGAVPRLLKWLVKKYSGIRENQIKAKVICGHLAHFIKKKQRAFMLMTGRAIITVLAVMLRVTPLVLLKKLKMYPL